MEVREEARRVKITERSTVGFQMRKEEGVEEMEEEKGEAGGWRRKKGISGGKNPLYSY